MRATGEPDPASVGKQRPALDDAADPGVSVDAVRLSWPMGLASWPGSRTSRWRRPKRVHRCSGRPGVRSQGSVIPDHWLAILACPPSPARLTGVGGVLSLAIRFQLPSSFATSIWNRDGKESEGGANRSRATSRMRAAVAMASLEGEPIELPWEHSIGGAVPVPGWGRTLLAHRLLRLRLRRFPDIRAGRRGERWNLNRTVRRTISDTRRFLRSDWVRPMVEPG